MNAENRATRIIAASAAAVLLAGAAACSGDSGRTVAITDYPSPAATQPELSPTLRPDVSMIGTMTIDATEPPSARKTVEPNESQAASPPSASLIPAMSSIFSAPEATSTSAPNPLETTAASNETEFVEPKVRVEAFSRLNQGNLEDVQNQFDSIAKALNSDAPINSKDYARILAALYNSARDPAYAESVSDLIHQVRSGAEVNSSEQALEKMLQQKSNFNEDMTLEQFKQTDNLYHTVINGYGPRIEAKIKALGRVLSIPLQKAWDKVKQWGQDFEDKYKQAYDEIRSSQEAASTTSGN